MVDVTVDQKPMPQNPYDVNLIPEAVRKRAEAVNALYSNGSQPSPAAEPAPVQLDLPLGESAPQASANPQPSSPASADPTQQLEGESPEDWKRRFLRMQGQYVASQKTIGELQEQMTQMGNELVHAQRVPPKQEPQRQQEAPRYLTEKDLQDYGPDLVNFTQRAAADAIAPQIQALDQQNRELQAKLAREARARLDMRVEAAVPDFREIDREPRWHSWLLGIDMLSGRVRQTLLNEAISAAEAPRVISFFRQFLQEEQATGHLESASNSLQAAAPREPAIPLASLAAPGRARPAGGGDTSLPPDRPIYTRAQIKQLYDQHRRGAYVGREADWARQEVDIIAAGREGRVR